MSTQSSTTTHINPTDAYCVWYATATQSEELDDIARETQIYQDLMVVLAASASEALRLAHDLLAKRCQFDFVITKVASRAELQSTLSTVLDRVARGEMLPATLADEDHMVWAERYLYSV